LQKIWFEHSVGIAGSPVGVRFLERLLTGKATLAGFPPGFSNDQEKRWDLITAISRNGWKKAPELIAAELKTDATDLGEKRALAAQVAFPDIESKKKWVQRLALTEGADRLPFARLRVAARAFHQTLGRSEISAAAADSYFSLLPILANKPGVEEQAQAKVFAESMFPPLCSEESVEKLGRMIKENPAWPSSVLRALKINRQQEERCIRARKLSMVGMEPTPKPHPTPRATPTSESPAPQDSGPSPSPNADASPAPSGP
jgi:aminopeptidase N